MEDFYEMPELQGHKILFGRVVGFLVVKTMKNAALALIVVMGLFIGGCEDTDIGLATQACIEAVRAVTLDDEEVKRLAVEVSKESDLKHAIAPPDHPYARRLERLTSGYEKFDGYEFDFKVYLSPNINAFAMADGSIRIYNRFDGYDGRR
jgi:putative metalloprotease